jgi:hypothetical protein
VNATGLLLDGVLTRFLSPGSGALDNNIYLYTPRWKWLGKGMCRKESWYGWYKISGRGPGVNVWRLGTSGAFRQPLDDTHVALVYTATLQRLRDSPVGETCLRGIIVAFP